MGDGAAKRGLLGLFFVNVDELVVASALGELVDALLVDLQPVRMAHILADQGRKFRNGNGFHRALRDSYCEGVRARGIVATLPQENNVRRHGCKWGGRRSMQAGLP